MNDSLFTVGMHLFVCTNRGPTLSTLITLYSYAIQQKLTCINSCRLQYISRQSCLVDLLASGTGRSDHVANVEVELHQYREVKGNGL